MIQMSRIFSLLFALVIGAGIVASLPGVCAQDSIDARSASVGDSGSQTCGDRYNALVAKAKAALIRGDRRATLEGLLAARSQLRVCEEREHERAAGTTAVALAM